ncbi:MAG TPA: prepilin-type N-terminal cleavage/methylation domain-containing protein [Fimbriimonadaceae bacterium]|jgi:general secretion pathway protein G
MRRGFTLIELLIVIAIIAIIAAILFPVFARAKAAAKSTTCISNLHQIGTSMLLYMDDYDDLFPNAIDDSDRTHPEQWTVFPTFQALIPSMPLMQNVLQPYIKSKEIFHCPSDSGTLVLDDHFPLAFVGSPSDFATFGSSYLYRTEITESHQTQTSLQTPAYVNVYFDAAGHWHGNASEVTANDSVNEVIDKLNNFRYNNLFADMHAKSESDSQMNQLWAAPL